MNFFMIVIKSLRQRLLSVLLTMFSIMLGICLVISIMILKKESEEAFTQTATGYELIVGPKGSPLQLTLNTVYQIGLPLGSMPLKTYELLKNDRRVKLAIPYILGDNYKDHRLIGTVPEIFSSFEYKKGSRYEFISGEAFGGEFEAVVGYDAAIKTGLKTGDHFTGSHGINSYEGAEEHEENKFKVTGILKKTFTPADNVIFVNMNSVWKIHEYSSHDHSQKEDTSHLHDNETISSVLVSLKSPVYFDLLRRQINDNKYEGINAQAVIPLFEIKQLFDIIGNINSILLIISYLVIFVAAVSIFVVLFNSMNERKREIAIMRSLGARKSLIMNLIIAEGIIITLSGAVTGVILSHVLIFLAKNKISELAGIQITGNFSAFEFLIIGAALLLGIVVSIIPGFRAYRTEAGKVLSEKN